MRLNKHPSCGIPSAGPTVPWPFIIIGLVMFIFVLVFLTYGADLDLQELIPWQAITRLKQLVEFAQHLVISLNINLKWWPEELKDLIILLTRYLSFFSFSLPDLVSPDCYTYFSYHDRLITTIASPCAVVIIAILTKFCFGVCNTVIERRRGETVTRTLSVSFEKRKAILLRSCTIALHMLYTPVMETCAKSFVYTTDDGTKFLAADTKLKYDNDNHYGAMAAAAATVLVYGLVVPAVTWRLVRNARDEDVHKNVAFHRSFGPLYQMYNDEWLTFEVFSVLKKAVASASTAFTITNPVSPTVVAGTLFAMHALYTALVLYARPFLPHTASIWRPEIAFAEIQLCGCSSNLPVLNWNEEKKLKILNWFNFIEVCTSITLTVTCLFNMVAGITEENKAAKDSIAGTVVLTIDVVVLLALNMVCIGVMVINIVLGNTKVFSLGFWK